MAKSIKTRKRESKREHPEGVCRFCGCTDLEGCPEGCWWMDSKHTLCSSCVPKLLEQHDELLAGLKALQVQVGWLDCQITKSHPRLHRAWLQAKELVATAEGRES